MDNKISVTCPSCGHSFQVRMPEEPLQGKKYRISYSCPRCGKQLSETRTFGDENKTGTACNGDRAGSDRYQDKLKDLKYIIGIPAAVLLLVFLVSVISGQSDIFPAIFQGGGNFGQRMAGYLESPEIMRFVSKLIVLFLCFPIHECAHAWMADKLGDPTGRKMGRITLNPLKHLDPWGTIMIFLVGVGYAKPVPVQINHFKNRKWGFALTALAGPVSNLIMSVLFLLLIKILTMITGNNALYINILRSILVYAAYINISLAVFNLIPIPPLDGSRVVTAILPDGAYNAMLRCERYLMFALLAAMYMLGSMGYSPIGRLSMTIFRSLFQLFRLG